jgi:Holliday junction DNA helicase RuvA
MVTAVTGEAAVIEVGGVGLLVSCSPGTLAGLRVGAPAELATSLVVREDSLTLYGFADAESRSLFELLQTASGVGPRVAQSVLAVLAPDVVRRAISAGDTSTLTQVPGIGKKGAERLVLELRDRIGVVASGPAGSVSTAWSEQVCQALVGLGWSAHQAEQAVVRVAADLDGQPVPPIQVLLKQAIRTLGRA